MRIFQSGAYPFYLFNTNGHGGKTVEISACRKPDTIDAAPGLRVRESWKRDVAYLRWRILARIRRFLRPIFRRPLPVFFVPILLDAPVGK